MKSLFEQLEELPPENIILRCALKHSIEYMRKRSIENARKIIWKNSQ